MNKEELSKTREALLEKIQDGLLEELYAAQIKEVGDKNRLRVLSVVFEDLGFDSESAIGDFYFRPMISDDDKVQHFCALITIADELNEDNLPSVYEAMSYINAKAVCGSFCIDKDKNFMAYRLCVPLSTSMTEDQLFEAMNVVMGNAVAACDMYMDILVRVMDGEATVQDVIDSLGD